ncbi:hypothetical protein HOLleu_21400 [Holothuria leucospilota]|uniref:Uncharacterized protein n=1 Tax=Holothuria leucospilota TaxID=206669 RepID=A0A9Q1BXG2_HOLLE|nr:hypothetical protein HOLleu_21400 [Holothuria leucospilota]
MNDFNLLDIWREQNPCKIEYTRIRDAVTGRTASRIDRLLISKSLMLSVSRSSINPYPKSDHNVVAILLNLSVIPRGKGTWILNNPLLKDEMFCAMIRNVIKTFTTDEDYENNFLSWYDRFKRVVKTTAIKSDQKSNGFREP